MNHHNKELQELNEHNEVLQNYFSNTIIPQMYVDGELILQKFTPPAMKQFNLSDSDIGKSLNTIVDNFRFPTIIDNIQEVIESKEILEKEIQTTDLRWYQMNILPYVKMKDNRTDGVIITFVEITMRIKDLKALDELIVENALLLDTISHDLRTPLANLSMLIEMLKSVHPNDEEEFTSIHKMVDSALLSMQNLVSELTKVRKEEFELHNHAELVDIEHVLEDVRLSLKENIVKTHARITTDIVVSEFRFTRRKLRTVLYNLINNAIKFKSPDTSPKILVTTAVEKEFIVITVRDNGIGIPENKIDSIFLKYGRLDNDIEGSGIGLYLVKEIVTNAGGKIEVKSNPQGSEFKVYLPKE